METLDEKVKEKRREYRKNRTKANYAAMWKAVKVRNTEILANALPKPKPNPNVKPITLDVQDGKNNGSSKF